jgi:hypothetical protein
MAPIAGSSGDGGLRSGPRSLWSGDVKKTRAAPVLSPSRLRENEISVMNEIVMYVLFLL